MSLLSKLRQFFGFGGSSDEQTSLGPAAITEAVYELSGKQFPEKAWLGEPRMVGRGGEFSGEYKVVIPVNVGGADDYDIPNLEFDLPDGLEDEDAQLYDFLDSFGIENIEDIEDVIDYEIGVKWTGGTPVPTWQ
jgi:hypothetical protein